jgi:ribonuclease T1
MRRLLHILVFLLAGLLPALAFADQADLRAFGRGLGLRDLDGFVEAVTAIREDGRLPERWITKREAERLGWRPGRDLCEVADDVAIGGDRFGNREGRLPSRKGRRWTEADLDFACGRRGAKRLVFSNDRLIFVTVDHYDTFHEVPE